MFSLQGDGVEVTCKVPTVSVDQSEEPSRHLPFELNCQSVYNDLNDQESPAGHSGFSPLCQQFNTPKPQVHNNSKVPITFEVQNTSKFPNISEVQNTSEEDCQDVPIKVNKEGSQFMNDRADFNNSPFQDLLNVIYDQTEKMEKEEFLDTNKSGSSDANKLVVEEVFMCPAPLQMVHDDQSNCNPERSMVLHPLLVVDEHTPLPIPRERRPGPINISPYVTSFGSESGSSSSNCGLYVASYADHISNGNGFPNSFDSEFTRIRYAALLWNYGMQKIQVDATSHSEAPERSIRIHRNCDSSERITIN
ncbi:hypothetical protein MTR67_030135 [Solanum verrucosum]|uniref:Uncharacterized protein n=1 Tax=Solanum verrucosum TaxID=315347 RepID=A0AAF0RC83_SOLVR|nr:hypothetical protein MTR67_030135 [Solanum verrucosum]